MQKNGILGFMHRKNISQKSLAKSLKCTDSMISFIVSGRSSLTFDKIIKLIEMGATTIELFGEKDGKKLLENSGAMGLEKDFEEKVMAVLNKVSNSGTIQIGVRG